MDPRRPPPSINTSGSDASQGGHERRFSYAETPLDLQPPQGFGRRQHYSHIQEQIPEAQSPVGVDGYHMQTRSPAEHPYASAARAMPSPTTAMASQQAMPQDKKKDGRYSGVSPYGMTAPEAVHPAYYAPVVSQTPPASPQQHMPGGLTHTSPQPQYNQQDITQRSVPQALPPQQSRRTSTIPMHSENDVRYPEPRSPVKASHGIQPDHIQVPYSPNTIGSPTQPVFLPNASTGPNGLIAEQHLPGQVAHPNMNITNSTSDKAAWSHSLIDCSDAGTCMTGLFCPCILDSRTSYRLGRKSKKQDPTEMLGFSSCNARCGFFTCGLCCLFPLTLRTRIRHMYKLQGSFCDDMVKSCCCCCCVVIQNEREVRDRETRMRQNAGPAGQYRSDTLQMVYTPGAT